MNREKLIKDIAAALATLENCSPREIEDTKKFLRWMPDHALKDMRDKHVKALERMVPTTRQ